MVDNNKESKSTEDIVNEDTNEVKSVSVDTNKEIDITLEEVKYNKKSVVVSQESPRKLTNEMNGIKAINPLIKFHDTKKAKLKRWNNNKAITFKVFNGWFIEYLDHSSISTKNEDLKDYIEDIFELFESNLIKDETIARLTQESASALVESCILLVRHMITDKNFNELVKGYNEKAISERSFPKVQENYNKLLNLIEAK